MSKKVKKPCDWCGDTYFSSITKDELTFCDKFCQEEYMSRVQPKVMVDMSKVDWPSLREQKEALLLAIGFGCHIGGYTPDPTFELHVEGIVCLLEHIQIEAAKIIGDEAVYGRMTQEQLDKANEEHMAIVGIVNRINKEESKGLKSPVARKRKK